MPDPVASWLDAEVRVDLFWTLEKLRGALLTPAQNLSAMLWTWRPEYTQGREMITARISCIY